MQGSKFSWEDPTLKMKPQGSSILVICLCAVPQYNRFALQRTRDGMLLADSMTATAHCTHPPDGVQDGGERVWGLGRSSAAAQLAQSSARGTQTCTLHKEAPVSGVAVRTAPETAAKANRR